MLVDKIFKLLKIVNIVSLHNVKCGMPWFTELLLLLMYCQYFHVDFDMKFASILLNVETFNMLFCGKANMSMLNFRCGAGLPFLTKWIKIETISSDLVHYT